MSSSYDRLLLNSDSAHIPRVTIGMPVYNGDAFIHEALDSVLAQTYTDFELLISDNASTDHTEAICRDYASKDSRIRYVRQEANTGPGRNFNLVLELAQGKYFTWLAHDDSLDAAYLDTLVKYLEEHEEVVLCASAFRVVRDGAVFRTITHDDLGDRNAWAEARRRFFTFSHDLVYLVYGVYRLDVMRENGIYLRNGLMGMANATEYSILSRLAICGRIVALPAVLRTYRRHYDSVAHEENRRTTQFRRLLNFIFVIVRDQVLVVLPAQLPIRDKIYMLISIVLCDLPILLLRTAAVCTPKKCWDWLARVKCLRTWRDRLRS